MKSCTYVCKISNTVNYFVFSISTHKSFREEFYEIFKKIKSVLSYKYERNLKLNRIEC